MDEVLNWFEKYEVDFVNGIPHLDGSTFDASERLFAPHHPGTRLTRTMTQLGMLASGGADGGLLHHDRTQAR